MGTAALILGICGAASSWIPFLGCLGWVACVLAIVFGALGLARANAGRATNRGSAVAGLTLGIVGVVTGVVLAGAVWNLEAAPSSSEDSSSEIAQDEPETESAETEEEGDDTEPAEEPSGIGAGIWEVGSEIEPGTYVATVPGDGVFDNCYAARLAGFSGEFEDIIANENFTGGARGRITIADDDTGVEFSGDCEWEAASDANTVELGDSVGDGTWEVGSEVQPGTYVTQPEGDGVFDSCYVARLSSFSMEFEDIIANDNVEGGAQGRITIEDSDTGVQFSGGCTWERE